VVFPVSFRFNDSTIQRFNISEALMQIVHLNERNGGTAIRVHWWLEFKKRS
jgi:hypothetical protein